jgi:ectoine hydroxylase-related dioxygenase (phytanoyl-CoA dioxygenase family)
MSASDAYCLQRHLDLICNKRKICQICKFFIGRKHICLNEKYCQKCKEIVQMDHLCFIKQQPEKKKEDKFNGLIFFDYEALVENSIHVPNLIIAHKVD